MTLCEKIGQLNLLAAGEGLVTGAKQPTSLAARLDAGQVGAIFGTKSLATARAMQERALAGESVAVEQMIRRPSGQQLIAEVRIDDISEDGRHLVRGSFVDITADECIIPPNSFALARTVEYFRIPRDTRVVCLGKSTYARCGIIVNVTPLEPEWEGHVTLEFSNTTPLPARIYANEGVAQMPFFQSDADDVCETSYKDRGGKYQGQTGVTLPKT